MYKLMINVGIIGATSYIGIEIVRLLQNHPKVNISTVVSQNYVGQNISNIYQNLNKVFDKNLEYLDVEKIIDKADIFFTCIPHGISKAVIPILVEHEKKVIDFSGDFLFNSIDLFKKFTNSMHDMPYLLQSSVYGLPELYKEKIMNSSIVGIPSSYSTNSILSLSPLLKNNLIDIDAIIINIVSAISEEGRSNDFIYQFCESVENFKLQRITNNTYKAEIDKEIELLTNISSNISLLQYTAPIKRGQLCTIHSNLKDFISENELVNLYKDFYKNSFFVRILENKIFPETKWVIGSNYIDIGFMIEKNSHKITILSAIDNLTKGSAGQAIQCLNIIYSFPESLGLSSAGFYI